MCKTKGSSEETIAKRPDNGGRQGSWGTARHKIARLSATSGARSRQGVSQCPACLVGFLLLPPAVALSDDLFRRDCIHQAGHVVVGIALARETGTVPVSARAEREFRFMQTNETRYDLIEGIDRTSDRLPALPPECGGRSRREDLPRTVWCAFGRAGGRRSQKGDADPGQDGVSVREGKCDADRRPFISEAQNAHLEAARTFVDRNRMSLRFCGRR
jgi:hypothetical protein